MGIIQGIKNFFGYGTGYYKSEVLKSDTTSVYVGKIYGPNGGLSSISVSVIDRKTGEVWGGPQDLVRVEDQ